MTNPFAVAHRRGRATTLDVDLPPATRPVEEQGLCDCGNTFRTIAGLQQHRRKAHPEVFFPEVQPVRTRARWSQEENAILVKADLNSLGGKADLQEVQKALPKRTVEALRSHRRSAAYGRFAEGMARRAREKREAEVCAGSTTGPSERPVRPGAGLRQCPAEPRDESAAVYRESLRKLPLAPAGAPWGEDLLDRLVHSSPQLADLQRGLEEHATVFLKSIKQPVAGARSKKARIYGSDRDLPTNARARRRLEYAFTQRMYEGDRTKCAEMVFKGEWADLGRRAKGVARAAIRTYWKEQFEQDAGPDERAVPRPKVFWTEVARPLTPKEIREALDSTSRSAAGPDGMTVAQLLSLPVRLLCKMFNLYLMAAYLPRELRSSRTTMIPKCRNPALPKDYRPISVGPVVVRLFHRILAKRLSATVSLHARQKGFLPLDGCAHNVVLFDCLVQQAKRMQTPFATLLLDLANAFGSVKHASIVRACQRLGVPNQLCEYIRSCYSESSTVLLGEKVMIRRGVRQGDPLSPFLFNAVMDEVLDGLDEDYGVGLGGQRVSGGAYADDTFLTAETTEGLQEQVRIVGPLLRAAGLAVNPKKCVTWRITKDGKRKRWVWDSTHGITIDGTAIPVLRPDSPPVKFLGIEVEVGGIGPLRFDELKAGLRNLTAARLKPQQRLFLLTRYLLPAGYHQLAFAKVTEGKLQRADALVRKHVRQWLALPRDAPTAFIHASVRDGGLGVPCLLGQRTVLRSRRLAGMRHVPDPVLQEMVGSAYFLREVRAASSVMIQGVLVRTRDEAREAQRRAMCVSVDGNGLREAAEVPQIHSWISDGTALQTGRDFVSAVRVRINALPCAARTMRPATAHDQGARGCAGGCGVEETLNHVSQACWRTHGVRVLRHNRVLGLFVQSLRRVGYTALVEPYIPTSIGARKPDVVAWKNDGVVHVVDVQVVSAGAEHSLATMHERKVRKYLLPEVTQWALARSGARRAEVSSLTFNWRGVLARASFRTIRGMGIRAAMLRVMAVRVLEMTAVMWRMFRHVRKGV
jgi:hypothetical protein